MKKLLLGSGFVLLIGHAVAGDPPICQKLLIMKNMFRDCFLNHLRLAFVNLGIALKLTPSPLIREFIFGSCSSIPRILLAGTAIRIALAGSWIASAADFQNLGFESAVIAPVPGDPDPLH